VRDRETACIVEMPVERIRAPDVVDDPQQRGWKSTKGTYGTVKSDNNEPRPPMTFVALEKITVTPPISQCQMRKPTIELGKSCQTRSAWHIVVVVVAAAKSCGWYATV
jgi:hypothetical protein